MQTLRLRVDPERMQDEQCQQALDRAASILRGGGIVALPTETVYGLGANALDANAVAGIFAAKQRPAWDPLIVHVSDAKMLEAVALPPNSSAQALIQAFWPGPLTLLLPRTSAVPDAVTAGRSLVGVRMPGHPVALQVIRRARVPIAAPSANRFGHVSPTTAEHVLEDLDGRIDAVVDAGPTAVGLESTVLDATTSPMIVYRPGAITLEQIRAVAGPAELYMESAAPVAKPRESLPSPGVGLRHYAPRARLVLVDMADSAACREEWTFWCAESLLARTADYPGDRVGIMMPTGALGGEPAPGSARTMEIFPWGNWSQPEVLAQRLFAGLRHLDSAGCSVILCPVPPGLGFGAAIRDRLRKAASAADFTA